MVPKLPFNLLGDDAKLAFRKQHDGIRKLAECKNIEEADAYWEKFVSVFDSTSDVFSLISPQDVRRALLECPRNVATLVRFLSARLFRLMSDHTFPSLPPTTVTSLASSIIKAGTGSNEKNTTKELLNCLRVLQRVLPVVFESESSNFEDDLLWTRPQELLANETTVEQTQDQFIIEDEEDSDDNITLEERPHIDNSSSRAEKPTTLPSLAERLLNSAVDLMFCCGFTLPTKLQVDYHKINYIIWEYGVGSTMDPGSNQFLDSNKVEVLRFILVLLSRQIYVSPGALLTSPSPYTLFMTQQIPRRTTLSILCSLLNTALNHDKNRTAVESMAMKLPYNHIVFKGEDVKYNLSCISLQVLCVLLDFQTGSSRDTVNISADTVMSAPTVRTNSFRYFLAKLHRPSDFSFILTGILNIFEQHFNNINNFLPGSRKPIIFIPEMVILFWKMIELNKKFRLFVIEDMRSIDLFSYLLCHSLEIKDKPEQHGLCRAISYIIQSLTCGPAFTEKLTSPLKANLPQKWFVSGTAADFMISCIYSIVATSQGILSPIYSALVIALSNSAPYFKNLTTESSNKLIRLFIAFSAPSFLLSDEGHPRILFFILETFNGVIINRSLENPHIIHAILHYRKLFMDLATFTFTDDLTEFGRKHDRKGKAVAVDEKIVVFDSDKEETSSAPSALTPLDNESQIASIGKSTMNNTQSSTSADRQTMTDSLSNYQRPGRSAFTPVLDTSPTQNDARPMSQKSLGKMKARSLSYDTTSNFERVMSTVVGRNGFTPTKEWVFSWHERLPLDPILLLISELLPKIQDIQNLFHKAGSTEEVTEILRSSSLQHLFPQATVLSPRPFVWSDSSTIWLTSLLWGEIYIRGMSPYGVWSATNVRLFHVKHSATQPRQLSEAVSHVVGLLNRGSSETQVGRSRNASGAGAR